MTDSLYKERYGARASYKTGSPPDYARCCEEVADYSTNRLHYHQCRRKRGHGPDGAYCKQHDPEAMQRRSDEAKAKWEAKWAEERYGWHGKTFFEALQKIAAGHDDARGLAQEVVDQFNNHADRVPPT